MAIEEPSAKDIAALRRHHYNAELVDIRRIHEELMILRVRPDAGVEPFEAGRWNLAGVGLWEERVGGCPPDTLQADELLQVASTPYSLSSSILGDDLEDLLHPQDEDYYEFYVAFGRHGATGINGTAVAARLYALQAGDRLWVGEPRGNYDLAGVSPEDDVLFLATGTGEAPHNRMLAELLRRGHKGRLVALVTVRHRRDLGYLEVHRKLHERFPNYQYIAIATRQDHRGARLQQLLLSGELERLTRLPLDPETCHVFVCGNSGMVGRPQWQDGRAVYPEPPGMIELLERRGYRTQPPGVHLHFESY